MEFGTRTIGKVHILRVDPGEDILESVKCFLQETGIQQAVVLGGYGTMAASRLHWVAHNKIPTENLFRTVQGGIEILAMNGLVVDGKPHIHVALSMPDGGFGGHLEPGCIAYVLCEIFFAQIEGAALEYKRVPVSIDGMGEGTVSRLMFTKD